MVIGTLEHSRSDLLAGRQGDNKFLLGSRD